MRAYKKKMPVISVRGLAVMPGMIIHFDIVKDTAVRSIERAMVRKDQHVFIVMAKEPENGKQDKGELYGTGCICVVRQVLKLPNKTIRVLVEGIRRADIMETYEEDELFINAFFEGAGLSGTEDEVLYQPLRDLGYDADTRYDYTKALLTVTDEEMKSLGEDREKAIRLANGLVYSPYGSTAYIIEKGSSHVFIVEYGEGLWVDVMPSEDIVHSFVVKCEGKDTQMKIAASFDVK